MNRTIMDTIEFEGRGLLHLLDDNTMISVGVYAEKWRAGFSDYKRENLPKIFKKIHNCTFVPDFDISTPMEWQVCPECGESIYVSQPIIDIELGIPIEKIKGCADHED